VTDLAQKKPTGQALNAWAQRKIVDAIASTGRSLPCTVVSVSGAIVTVAFQVTAIPGATPITLPQVTIPIIGSEYVRLPIQPGCKGMTVAADAYLGGMSGIGGGTATTAQTGNLTPLAFVPLGNVGFFSVNGQVLTMYGPSGVTLMDAGETTILNLTPGQISLSAGGHMLTINAAGVTIDGIMFDTHKHTGVQGGSGETGGPVS